MTALENEADQRRCDRCGEETYNNDARCEQCKLPNPFREREALS